MDEGWAISQLAEILLSQELNLKKVPESIDIYDGKTYKGEYDPVAPIKNGTIAHISFSGVMMENGGWCQKGMNQIALDLRGLYANPNISGILFSLSTGGGEATSADVLFNAIKDRNKPVGIYTTYLASAGVKGTLAADFIMAASESTEVGSIGVMIQLNKDLLTQLKEKYLTIYSSKSENKNEEIRALLLEDVNPMIDRLTKLDDAFMAQVQKYRNLKGDVEETLSGRVFPGLEALNRGLVDKIGTFNDAISSLEKQIHYYQSTK